MWRVTQNVGFKAANCHVKHVVEARIDVIFWFAFASQTPECKGSAHAMSRRGAKDTQLIADHAKPVSRDAEIAVFYISL
jgi:hypothetical protein